MERHRVFRAGLAAAVLVLLASCAPAKAPEPVVVVATRTPKATFTPTVAVTPTRLIIPTATQPPTAAPTKALATPTQEATPVPPTSTPQSAPQFTANQTVNVRQGPGTNYPVIGQVNAGDQFKVMAKNQDGSWLQFNYSGDPAWVNAGLVTFSGDANAVQVAQNIPAAPTARPAPPPPPTSPPQPTQPPKPSFQWALASSGQAAGQCGVVHFKGQVQYANGSPQNGVCLYLDYYGPRTIKYSGGGGSGDGNFEFAPCGATQACNGPFQVYIVQCPANVPGAGLTLDSGYPVPAPLSEKFTVNVTNKCQTGQWEGIVFKNTQ